MGQSELKKRGIDTSRLTDKQRKFVHEYVIDYNGARAARAAGYKNPAVIATQLLDHPLVSQALGKLQSVDKEQMEIRREDVLKHLLWGVTRDPVDLVDPKTGLIIVDDLRKLPERIRCCIEGIEVEQFTDYETGNTTQKIKLKLMNKVSCLDLAMKHKGLFAPAKTESEQTVKVQFPFEMLHSPPSLENDQVESAMSDLVIDVLPNKKK